MPFIDWLISKMMRFFFSKSEQRKVDVIASAKEAGNFRVPSSNKAQNFEADYNAATELLRQRIDKKFPNGHYARLQSNENSPYDHGEDRALAVDTMSTAIAMALRNGATVRQAAEAGAASVGI